MDGIVGIHQLEELWEILGVLLEIAIIGIASSKFQNYTNFGHKEFHNKHNRNAIDVNAPLSKNAKPGQWNDPDMLVGSDNRSAVSITPIRARTMFSLW